MAANLEDLLIDKAAGAQGYVVKPAGADELTSEITRLINTSPSSVASIPVS
jgi:CheY-like chemotaxis protein